MALHVDFNTKIGTVTLLCLDENHKRTGLEFPLYKCDGLYAVVDEYTDEVTGKEMAQLVSFAIGEGHFKNMLGISKGYTESVMDDYLKFELDFSYPECGIMAKHLAKAMAKGRWRGTLSAVQSADQEV